MLAADQPSCDHGVCEVCLFGIVTGAVAAYSSRGAAGAVEGADPDPEGEHCHDCGKAVEVVWTAPEDLWAGVTGRSDGGGILCIRCFDKTAEQQGRFIRWVPREEGRATTPEAPVHRPIKRIRNRMAEERCLLDNQFWPCSAAQLVTPEAPASPPPVNMLAEAIHSTYSVGCSSHALEECDHPVPRDFDAWAGRIHDWLASAAPSEPGEPQP